MAGNTNIVPLHKTVNWKNLKGVIKETVAFINRKIYNKEQIDLKILILIILPVIDAKE